jgi:two-component system phosphate regulon sensor histidine kinase PhoR
MDQDIIASVPVGLVIFIALALLALGVAIGWNVSRARLQRRSGHLEPDHPLHINALLNALPQAAMTTDSDAHITTQNSSAVQLLRELKFDSDLPLTVDAAIGRVIRSGMTETMEIAPSGIPARRVQVTVAPLRTSATEPEALVLFTDLSSRSNREEVYQRLTSTIAHELRTPLTAIMGHVDILNSCQIDEEALWRRSVGFVGGETERLARLVEDLLSLSRLDRIPLYLQPVNLRIAAEEAISALFDAAEQNHIVPIFQAPTDLPRVLADPDRIRQVFLNLLDNAIKYAPHSTVTIRLTPETGIVQVEVEDSGPGIPPQDLPHIFEPFRRGEQVTPGSRGTGLGLTIVRAILDQHQAPISVRSELQQGTTFRFSLPVAGGLEAE